MTKKYNVMSVDEAARVLRTYGEHNVAEAIQGLQRAILEWDQGRLLSVLNALDGITSFNPHGALKRTLNEIAEGVAGVLLDMIVEQLGFAGWHADQLEGAPEDVRTILLRRIAAAHQAARSIRFPRVGMWAIERLIREDRLPEAVKMAVHFDIEFDIEKYGRKPASALLKALLRPLEEERRHHPQRRASQNGVSRPGKTERDILKYGSREKRDRARRERQLARSQPCTNKK